MSLQVDHLRVHDVAGEEQLTGVEREAGTVDVHGGTVGTSFQDDPFGRNLTGVCPRQQRVCRPSGPEQDPVDRRMSHVETHREVLHPAEQGAFASQHGKTNHPRERKDRPLLLGRLSISRAHTPWLRPCGAEGKSLKVPVVHLRPMWAWPHSLGLMSRRRWSDYSPNQQRALAIGGIVEVALTTCALVDLAKRPSYRVRGAKWMWAAGCLVQPVGPVAYFSFGRR